MSAHPPITGQRLEALIKFLCQAELHLANRQAHPEPDLALLIAGHPTGPFTDARVSEAEYLALLERAFKLLDAHRRQLAVPVLQAAE